MNDTTVFIKEVVGRAILIAVSIITFSIKWWIPLILAPLFWQIWDTAFGRRSRILSTVIKLTADAITWILWLSYIVYAIISFGLNVGHWYGWLIGLIIGLVVAQFLGLIWPHRWHLERVDDNL